MSMKELFTPKQVARAIGVSDASLKRWCDKGLIASVKTAGGHRRIPINGVVQFLRRSGHPLVRPEVLGLPATIGLGETVIERAFQQCVEALSSGDGERFRRIVFNLYLAGHCTADISDRVLALAFRELGRQWQHGALSIYQERRACEIALNVLFELRQALHPIAPDAPSAIGCTVEGDPYTLPTKMVELTLREAGWRAESYGIGIPFSSLTSALEQVRPRLLWLSVSSVDSAEDFLASYQALYEQAARLGVAVMVGGRGLSDDNRRQMRYSAFGDSMRNIVDFAMTLYRPATMDEDASPSSMASSGPDSPA